MEIERKFLIRQLPDNLDSYPFHRIEQGYLCTDPVVRIRRQDETYYLTYKSKGLMVREEYNLPLTKEAYSHLLPKIDGILIAKKRYLIPVEPDTSGETSSDSDRSFVSPEISLQTTGLTIELDIFEGELSPLILAEVEFSTEEEANRFVPPEWFGEDVTYSVDYHNSVLSRRGLG